MSDKERMIVLVNDLLLLNEVQITHNEDQQQILDNLKTIKSILEKKTWLQKILEKVKGR